MRILKSSTCPELDSSGVGCLAALGRVRGTGRLGCYSEQKSYAAPEPSRSTGTTVSLNWWRSPVDFSDYTFDLGAKGRPEPIFFAEVC